MPDWLIDLLKWLAGTGLGALVTLWFVIRRGNAKARAFDSGLEYISSRERAHFERLEAALVTAQADLKMKEIEAHDLVYQKADAEKRLAVLLERHAKVVIDVAAAMPAMSIEEREDFRRTTGFSEPDF